MAAGAAEASDVYSLALTLYECWTGLNPVARDTPAQTAREIGGPIAFLGEHRPDLPVHLADCLDACLEADPEVRPALEELDHHLDAAIPRLDGDAVVPAHADEPESETEGHPALLRVAQLGALCAWGVAIMLLAVAAGRPGLALVAGALSAPAILAASWLPWAGIPVLAPLLAAASAGGAYPALAGARGTIRERFVLGVLGWCWMLCAAAAFGLGSTAGLVDDAPSGWMQSTGAAASGLLAPLVAPQALLGAAIFGAAAALLGVILRAGHIAVALLGALLWAGGLDAALRVVGDGGIAGVPVVAVAAAAIAVIVEFRQRWTRPAGRPAPIPSARPAIGRGRGCAGPVNVPPPGGGSRTRGASAPLGLSA